MSKDYKAPMGEGVYEVNTGDWRMQFPEMDKMLCTECGICFMYCPVNSIKAGKHDSGREGKAATVYSIDLSYCKGCGICAYECPRNAIAMQREKKK